MALVLRPYQERAVADIREAFRRVPRVLFQAPTGAGKTAIMAHIAGGCARAGWTVWIAAHKQELIEQTVGALQRAGVACGVITADTRRVSDDLVQVVSIGTVARRLDRLLPPRFLLNDEAHHAISATYTRVMDFCGDGKILGVTATPLRLDGRGLEDAFDELVPGPEPEELIRDGYLADYMVVRNPGGAPDLSGVRKIAGDYDAGQLAAVMDDPVLFGDAIEQYRKHVHGRPAIAFCVSVAHAEHTAEAFRAVGYRSVSVDGTLNPAERRRRINGLADGTVQVLTSCALISEGLDVPACQASILLRPTGSLALYLQQVGRCLRPKEDGLTAVILDHADNVRVHGLPCAKRAWSLEGRKKRPKAGESAPGITTCERCYCMWSRAKTKNCPNCGWAPPVLKRDGPEVDLDAQMEAFTRDDPRIAHLRTAPLGKLLKTARTRPDLEAIAEARGYRPAWVEHALREKAAAHDRYRAGGGRSA